jgi:hypothetical protein
MISRPGESGSGGVHASNRLEVPDPRDVRPAARRRRRLPPARTDARSDAAGDRVLAPEYRRTDYTPIFLRSAFVRLVGSGRLPAGRFTFAGLVYSREGEALSRRFGFRELKDGQARPDRMPLYAMTFDSIDELWTLLDRVAPRDARTSSVPGAQKVGGRDRPPA